MPFPRRLPFSFPPRGTTLVLLCALYFLPGLVGHDPWKSDDATHFGIVFSLLDGGSWLLPQLAGEAWLDNPPLYYWAAAALATLLHPLLPLHDAARLTTGLFGAIMLISLAATARRDGERGAGGTAILIAIGCLGLLIHGHDAQPAIALLAAIAATLFGLRLLAAQPLAGGALAGISLSLGFLASGLPALLGTAPLLLLLPLASRHWRGSPALRGLLLASIIAIGGALAWPLALAQGDPAGFSLWLTRELADLRPAPAWSGRLGTFTSMLGWFAWPALPLALWTLWRARRRLAEPAMLLPLLAFALQFVVQTLLFEPRSLNALPLLPALVLLAVPAAGALRRGAANAFDWFGMMTFTLVAGLVWLGWVAMVAGVPARIARNFAKIEPGFVAHFAWPAFLAALLLTLAWLWLIFASPRTPLRATTHWAAGVTLTWCLLMALWLPWIDYGKSYRSVAAALKAALPAQAGCIAGRDLGEAQRASFHYFAGIITQRHDRDGAAGCRLMLTQTTVPAEVLPPGDGWRKIWEGHRRGDRFERFRLYMKD